MDRRAPQPPQHSLAKEAPQRRTTSKNETHMAARGAILPLPQEVVAQIKSSTAIVSLTGVVLELLKNSLDAGAAKVEVSVDFGRGGCSVQDDGLGIPPAEFREGGGLGKLYCTSKYHSTQAWLGRNGTFLASLSAMSLLTITSRHHEHRSLNCITFHQSKVIDRQLPAHTQHEVILDKHGTRVTVRNLFGNLPVRAKQRSLVANQKHEYDRLWDDLKREITGLVFSCRRPLSLRIRDADNKTNFTLNCQSLAPSRLFPGTTTGKPRSSQLHFLLNVLTQASYIAIEDWDDWVPASAATSSISVKGAISLKPAPTKRVQFISFGIQPLSPSAGHNELYDEVNRIFSSSSFGTVEDDADVDELEKIRRRSDKRFKADGHTNRQFKGRKSIDRWPMFQLQISLKDAGRTKVSGPDAFLDDETNLQAVVEVLTAMIMQWLSVHHFRPRKPRTRKRPETASTSTNATDDAEASPSPQAGTQLLRSVTAPARPSSTGAGTRKRRRLDLVSDANSKTSSHTAFTEWSRIKSAKPEFFDSVWSSSMQGKENGVYGLVPEPSTPEAMVSAVFDAEPLLPGALMGTTPTDDPVVREDICREDETSLVEQDDCDNTTTWTDPSTKQTFLLNARTGAVMPQISSRLRTVTSIPDRTRTLSDYNKPLRLRQKTTGTDVETPWLSSLLQNWDNPVFKPAEKRIPQVMLAERLEGTDNKHSHHFGCARFDMDKAFSEASASSTTKLSKESLQNAQVIAQVDKKFILVKMRSLSTALSDTSVVPESLVLIDQHAADERIRVEDLLSELCRPVSTAEEASYRSPLGHEPDIAFTILDKPLQFILSSEESGLFKKYAARFAAWGILYDVVPSVTAGSLSNKRIDEQVNLCITTLPPTVAERCKSDPKLLIDILRATVWKYAEDPHLPPLHTGSSATDGNDLFWVKQLATCPSGLVDMINSRACRSAIMFNDALCLQECEELVQKLARCVFPFMCAHGRPSMVPLVDISGVGGGVSRGFGVGYKEQSEQSFVDAWKGWQRTEVASQIDDSNDDDE